MASGTEPKPDAFRYINGQTWKDKLEGGINYFYFATSTPTDYDIPTGYCVVVAIKISDMRVVAFAVDWRKDQSAKLWICKKHDSSWSDWGQV